MYVKCNGLICQLLPHVNTSCEPITNTYRIELELGSKALFPSFLPLSGEEQGAGRLPTGSAEAALRQGMGPVSASPPGRISQWGGVSPSRCGPWASRGVSSERGSPQAWLRLGLPSLGQQDWPHSKEALLFLEGGKITGAVQSEAPCSPLAWG